MGISRREYLSVSWRWMKIKEQLNMEQLSCCIIWQLLTVFMPSLTTEKQESLANAIGKRATALCSMVSLKRW